MSDEIYTRYYSASDVQVILSNMDSTEILTLDLATGIGFNENAPMQPIYSLGNQLPSFFVKRNSIVTGFIGLAYQYEAYLRRSIKYVNGIKENSSTNIVLPNEDGTINTFEQLQTAIALRNAAADTGRGSSSIGAQLPFKLTIIFSKNTVNDSFESITMGDCYLTGRSVMVNTDGENPLGEGFSFIASQLI